MKDATKYLGLDVSKEKIAVAIADEGRGASRYWRKMKKGTGGNPVPRRSRTQSWRSGCSPALPYPP